MFTHCVYHFPCFDGYTSSFVVWLAYGEDVEYIPANYGDPLPDFPEEARILMVDVSWPREELIALKERVEDLVVLDHHATAREALSGLDFAHFDLERSGAGLTWDYLNPNVDRPDLIKYVEDRDLWRFSFPETKKVHAFLSSLPWSFGAWSEAYYSLETDAYGARNSVLAEGEAILRYADKRHQEVAELFHLVLLPVPGEDRNIVFPAANNTLRQFASSGIHTFLEKNSSVDYAGTYGRGPDGQVYWSLRSQDHFDCSKIAKLFGGGGHPQASGFVTEEIPEFFSGFTQEVVAGQGTP